MINSNSKVNKQNYWIMFILAISCLWVELYPNIAMVVSGSYNNYGNIFSPSTVIFGDMIFSVFISSLVLWCIIELLMITYTFITSFKIYSYILPPNCLKNEIRTALVYRNLILGLFVNICFIFPFLHSYFCLADLLITTITFILFSMKLQKNYSEPLIGHFVFKCFMNPILIYETLIVIANFVEVVL